MGKFDKFCQSCGIPLEKDPNHGGTNADGSKSTKYCSYCYENGAFIGNFTTAKEMQEFVREQLKKQGYWLFTRYLYTMHIPQLERWKK